MIGAKALSSVENDVNRVSIHAPVIGANKPVGKMTVAELVSIHAPVIGAN